MTIQDSVHFSADDNVTIMDASVYTISDVTIGTEYLISVAAITSRGETGYSKPVKVTVRPPKGLRKRFTMQNSMHLWLVVVVSLFISPAPSNLSCHIRVCLSSLAS